MIPKLTSRLAIDTLARAKTTPTLIPAPFPAPAPRIKTRSTSRDADKFVLRAAREVIRAIEEMSKRQGRSANAEIARAAAASLSGRQEAVITQKALVAYLGPERSDQALQQIMLFNLAESKGRSKKVIRLPDGIRAGIADVVEQSIKHGGRFGSMNTWFVDAIVWWINNQRESNALLQAAVEMDRERCTVQG